MRVTEGALTAGFLQAMRTVRTLSAESLQQLADGKRVRYGSDDPFAARAALELRARLVGIEGYQRAGSTARTDLETIDSVISEAGDILAEARTLAVRGGSDVVERETIAVEIDALRDRLLALSNTRQNDRYLFSGTATLTRPFDSAGVYQGNADSTSPEIDDGLTVDSTLDGSRAFDAVGNVFDTLERLSAALRADDGDAVRGVEAELSAQLDNLNAVHTEIGTRVTTIDAVRQRLDDRRFSIESRIIELEDIDIEEVVTRLVSSETGADALSAAAARVLGRSLFDFLA